MAQDLLFKNPASGQGSVLNFVQDTLPDESLPATNNSGLTDTAATNPQGNFFSDAFSVKFGSKRLMIKGYELESDRSKWIENKPTYKIIWDEDYPGVNGYAVGVPLDPVRLEDRKLQMLDPNAAIGVNGVMQNVSWLMAGAAGTSAGVYPITDGVTGTAIFMGNKTAGASATPLNGYVHGANLSDDLHDFRIQSILTGGDLTVAGVDVYFGQSAIIIPSGKNYVNKYLINKTTGSTYGIDPHGSSMGCVQTIYETITGGFSAQVVHPDTIQSIAIGTNGTNLLAVSAGHGASFPAGVGIIVNSNMLSGSSYFITSVASVSTDTLTLGSTLPFGVSLGLVYRAWNGFSNSINASLMVLADTIEFSKLALGVSQFISPTVNSKGEYGLWVNNVGITASGFSQMGAQYFAGSGSIRLDGHFSALDFEAVGGGILNVQTYINGIPGATISLGLTGTAKFPVMTDGPVGWNSVELRSGISMSPAVLLTKLNLYQGYAQGASFGNLATIRTNQALTVRPAQNASLMALGIQSRTYADSLKFASGTRLTGFSFACGVAWAGSSTQAFGFTHSFFGRAYGIIGTAGSSYIASVDGSPVTPTFGQMNIVAEGWHTLGFLHKAGTSIIQAVDVAKTYRDIEILNKEAKNRNSLVVEKKLVVFAYASATQSVSATTSVNFDVVVKSTHGASVITTGTNWRFNAPREDEYDFKTLISASSTVASAFLWVYKNGIKWKYLGISTDSTGTNVPTLSFSETLFPGEYIDIRATNNAFPVFGSATLAGGASWISIASKGGI